MKNISYKSIILSNLLDLILSFLIVTIYIILYILSMINDNIDLVSKVKLLNDSVESLPFIIAMNILSVFFPIMTGYFGAKIAKTRYKFHGMMSTILTVITSVLLLLFDNNISTQYTISIIFSVFVSPFLGAYGGYLYSLKKDK